MELDALLWATARDLLLVMEGGYVNDPRDPGGETRFGISKRAYPSEDIANLTRERASAIYHEDYWARIPSDLPAGVRWFAFDCAVHHGMSRALAWLREHGNVTGMAAARLWFMTQLAAWPTYGRGWVRRVATVLASIRAWEREHGRTIERRTVVLHDWLWLDRLHAVYQNPIIARGAFVVTERGGKLDVRRA